MRVSGTGIGRFRETELSWRPFGNAKTVFALTFPSSRGAFRLASTRSPSILFIEILPSAKKQSANSGAVKQTSLKAKDWCICAVGRTTRHLEWWRSRRKRNENSISSPIRTHGRVIPFLTGFIQKIDRSRRKFLGGPNS